MAGEKRNLTLIVCGGRNYEDAAKVNETLDRIHAEKVIACIVEGGAMGADRLACQWAKRNDIPVREFQADWKNFGKAAGAIRNKQMLMDTKPDGIVAFEGGRGTQDMIVKGMLAKVPVMIVKP